MEIGKICKKTIKQPIFWAFISLVVLDFIVYFAFKEKETVSSTHFLDKYSLLVFC